MIKTGLFDRNHLATLKKAVDVYARRHQVTAQNISNVETPGYRAQQVRFEEYLADAGTRLHGYRTQDGHLPIGGPDSAADARERTDDAKSLFDNGVNNVDIDAEMTSLATNDLSYRMATRLLSQRYSMLRGAIKGRMA